MSEPSEIRVLSTTEIRALIDKLLPVVPKDEQSKRPMDAKFAAVGTVMARIVDRQALIEAQQDEIMRALGMLGAKFNEGPSEPAPPAGDAPTVVGAPTETASGEPVSADADPEGAAAFIMEGIPKEEGAAPPAPATQPSRRKR